MSSCRQKWLLVRPVLNSLLRTGLTSNGWTVRAHSLEKSYIGLASSCIWSSSYADWTNLLEKCRKKSETMIHRNLLSYHIAFQWSMCAQKLDKPTVYVFSNSLIPKWYRMNRVRYSLDSQRNAHFNLKRPELQVESAGYSHIRPFSLHRCQEEKFLDHWSWCRKVMASWFSFRRTWTQSKKMGLMIISTRCNIALLRRPYSKRLTCRLLLVILI